MSIQKMKDIFHALDSCEAWSLQLLKIKPSKNAATIYMGREISFTPVEKINDFVAEISEAYVGPKGKIESFTDILDYDGSALGNTIYKLSATNELIDVEYQNFSTAVAYPDAEINPLEFKFQAYLLNGAIEIAGDVHPVKLISMQNPITTLKHKFYMAAGSFKEISEKVLSLHTSTDVVIIDEIIYMLTLNGEKLFNMERSYKAVSATKIADVQAYDIVTDFEAFSAVAASGPNPRKFVSFNDQHLQKLKNGNSRKKMARKFKIPLVGDKFDTTQPDAANKLVKLLCARGMVDPFDDNPMEVAGSKKWE